ncbi:MAG: tetratricopeptide repeat protein, partial [bacterium]|nr:tetratricopeptide repeat protein [bacterium]
MPVPKVLVALVLSMALLGCGDAETRKQTFIKVGRGAFERGDYATASVVFRKAIQLDRRFTEAYYWAGMADSRLGREAQALDELRRAVSLEPQHREAFSALANLYMHIHQNTPRRRRWVMKEMNRIFEMAEPYHRDSFAWNRVRGQFLLLQGEFDEAERYLTAAVAESEELSTALMLSWAQALAGANRVDEAIDLVKRGIQTDPEFEPFYNFLYQVNRREGRPREAEQALIDKRVNNPGSVGCALDLARHYHTSGRPQEMEALIAGLEQALDEDPSGYALLGDFFHELGEHDRALVVYRQGLERSPDRLNLFRKKMSRVYASSGEPAEALALVNQVLDDSPNDAGALAARGTLRLREGDPAELDAAIDDLRLSVAQKPTDPKLRYHLAVSYLRAGDLRKGLEQLQEAVRLRPAYVAALYQLAIAQKRAGQAAKSTATVERILRLRPKHPDARVLLAQQQLVSGRPGDTRKTLGGVLQDFPKHRGAAIARAKLDLREKRYGEAEAHYRALVQQYPDNNEAFLGLVTSLIVQRKLGEAEQLLRAAIAVTPNKLALHQSLANLMVVRKDHAAATEALSSLVNLHPTYLPARLQLAGLYGQIGKIPEAKNEYRKAIDVNPNAVSPVLQLAYLLERNGEPLEALPLYEEALK